MLLLHPLPLVLMLVYIYIHSITVYYLNMVYKIIITTYKIIII